MQTILVPHTVDTSSARLWVCTTESDSVPPGTTVTLSNGMTVEVRSADWTPVTAGGALSPAESRTFKQVVEFRNLSSGKRFVATANEATARFSTLPVDLPRVGETPFTVLLGSCYFGDRDRGVSTLIHSLLQEVRPDIKFLCGDQVYLDFPSFILGVPFDARGKAKLFLSKYLRNWGLTTSYRSLLQVGATYFSSDDHEFWNNFPNPATIISSTWTAAGRTQYEDVARPLFKEFQTDLPGDPPICRKVKVGNLSFMVADTRLHREAGNGRFMNDDELAEVENWAKSLDGPGVLVVGQPVLDNPQTGFFGGIKQRFGDRNLPDYDQYPRLVNALLSAPHSLLILTGDVHYPRVAQAVHLGQASRDIVEVIASPAALVAGKHPNTAAAPGKFPSQPIAGSSLPVQTFGTSRHAGDNLVTMDFTETPGRIHVQIRYWYIGEPQFHGPTFELTLT